MNIKLVFFDLDKTLADPKSAITPEMSKEVAKLLEKTLVSVISGGDFPQYQTQFLDNLNVEHELFNKLHLLPTCGTQYYKYDDKLKKWSVVYQEPISQEGVKKILKVFNDLVIEERINELPQYGERIENRANSQITLSILGQQAPKEVKKDYDPDKTKRLKMIAKIKPLLPEFEIAIGGATSIDITKPGVNKAYGIRKLSEILEIDFSDMIYVGDDLQEGGNDYPARSTGVRCIETSGPEETLEIIKNLILELGTA